MHAVRRCTPGCIGGVRRGKITRRRRRSAAADKPDSDKEIRLFGNLATVVEKLLELCWMRLVLLMIGAGVCETERVINILGLAYIIACIILIM